MNSAKFYSMALAGLLISNAITVTLSEEDMLRMNLSDFTLFFNRAYLGVVLLILLILVLDSHLKINGISAKTGQVWAAAFGSILLISASVSYYANPHGRFSTQRYLFTSPSARKIKGALFEQIDYNPQVVIMGTSRAFLLSPEYIYQKTGYKAFNFSVEGAAVIDYIWELNYILGQKSEPPQVLIVDLGFSHLPSGLASSEQAQIRYSLQPLSLLPYVSLNQKKEILVANGADILSAQSFSDSFYLIKHPFLTPDVQTWTFQQADGSAVRRDESHKEYVDALQNGLDNVENYGYFCNSLESDGEELIEQFVSNAEQHHIGVVMYQSPVNGTILEKLLLKKDEFYHCKKNMDDFVNRLKSKHENVWYVGLIDDTSIADMKEDGFYDHIHLRSNTSQAVVDELIPSIHFAVQWSEAQ